MVRKKRRPNRTVSLGTPPTILAVDANFEPITQAGFQYRQINVYPYLAAKGFTIHRCQGSLARKIYVAPATRQPNVVFITGIGHGSYNSFTGDYYDPVLTVGNYSQEEAQGKILHLLSCETARDLGPDLVSHGSKAYFGYDENFSFQMDDADIFFECDSEIDKGFADGQKASDVYARVMDLFNKNIAVLRARGSEYKAATLEFDRDHLRAPASGPQWGDPNATLD